MASQKPVSEDLVRERKKCTFNIQELTHICDGGEDVTRNRKEIERIVLSCKELKDDVPEEYLSYVQRYENTVRKVCILTNLLKEKYTQTKTSMDQFRPTTAYKVTSAAIKDMSPFMLHLGMFIPTLLGQCTSEQLAKWLPRALGMNIIGTYAQTELGHGTFLRGLETTATYDAVTEEFVFNSPGLTAYKWWPGGLGHTVNYAIVVAQLYTQGKCHGVHPFICQLRDEETHIPLPGITIGDIGPKMAFQTANNGFLGFKNYRIPREHMLMKNSQVLKDGTYVKSPHEKLAYGSMVYVRVLIVNDAAYEVAKAATIAIRYSAVRHQSKPKADEPEPQILDYVTQQHKLLIAVASSHALRSAGSWLWETYDRNTMMMTKGNLDLLPEMHVLACGLKALCSAEAAAAAERCRLACGGHGYVLASHLPVIYAHISAANTYEGENTVLLLQVARYLVKALQQASQGQALSPTVAYLANKSQKPWTNTPEGIVRGFQTAAAGRLRSSVEAMEKQVQSGMSLEDAWNAVSVRLVAAAEAHVRSVLCDVFWNETLRITSTTSKPLAEVLQQLAKLYVTYWALERVGDFLMFSNISQDDVEILSTRYEQLLRDLRPNAVGLVDAFDIPDEVLHSALGAYDGRVYERLMEQALKSPLNAEPVNSSFHKYLKPFMQGKL